MKRIIALSFAFVILFSSFACPVAEAGVVDDYTNSSFAHFLLHSIFLAGGFAVGGSVGALIGEAAAAGVDDAASYYAAGYTDDELLSAYSADVSTLQSNLGSAVIGDGVILFPLEAIVIGTGSYSGNLVLDKTLTVKGVSFAFGGSGAGGLGYYIQPTFSGLYAPLSGYIVGGLFVGTTSNVTVQQGTYAGTYLNDSGDWLSISAYYPRFLPVDYGNFSVSGTEYLVYKPDSWSTSVDTSPTSRAGVLTGSYSSGDTVYENVTIVNELEKTFYNPTTGTTTAYDHFVYDYATRTYTLYDADGNVIAVITYGDDQLTISQGGTDTPLNYAVSSDDSGTLDGEAGSGTSLLDTIKDGILGVLKTLIEGVFALIKTILEKLLGLAKDLLSFFFDFLSTAVLGSINAMLNAFKDASLFQAFSPGDGTTGYVLPEGVPAAFTFISGVYLAFPDDLRSVFTFGIAALFLFAIFRLFKS